MSNKLNLTLRIPATLSGLRLDQALAKLLPDYSRTQIKTWLDQNEIKLNNQLVKAKTEVLGDEEVTISATLKTQPVFEAQSIPLSIIHEDEELLIINKPVGLVVHPAPGNLNNTLLNALLHHAPTLAALPRAGIIHRLDKDTSGLLVIAKTPLAFKQLSLDLKNRQITRLYQAIVSGVLISGGTIEAPIGRHPLARTKMAVIDTGKEAITHYRIMERYRSHTRLKIQLETGRTHQIRVHLAYLQYPIVGDAVYGGRLQLPKNASPELITVLRQFKRQALHASELQLQHPGSKKKVTYQAPLPEDMITLIDVLKREMEQ